MTIRGRLWLLAVGTLLAISCMVGIVYVRSSSVLSGMINDTGNAMVQDAADTMDLYFESMNKVLLGISDSLGYLVEHHDLTDQHEIEDFFVLLQKTYTPRGVMNVFMGLEENGALAIGSGWQEGEDYDARVRSWYKESLANKGISLSSPYIDAGTGQLVISLMKPLYLKNGDLFGVVGLDIGLDYLSELIAKQNINGVGFGVLLDTEGNILAAPEKDWVLKENITKESQVVVPALASFGKVMMRELKGTGDYKVGGEGKRMYFATTEQGYKIGIEYPLANIRATVRSVTFWLLVVGALALLVVVVLVVPILRSLNRDIRTLLETTRKVGEGDLTVAFNQQGKTEIHRIGEGLNAMLRSLRELIGAARSSSDSSIENAQHLAALSEETVGSMEEIRTSMTMMEETFRENAAALEETNASIEEVASGANSAAHSSTEGAEAAARAMETAEGAVDRVGKVIGDIGEVGRKAESSMESIVQLAASVNDITSFVATITGIADQTNLLALNAAIEAARAGEAGRGFAVVAEEVRKLAEESNRAAHKVGDIIEGLRGQSETSIKISREAGELMQSTVREANEARDELQKELEAIQNVNDAMQNIAAVSEEQAAASTEMAEAVGGVTESIAKLNENVSTVSASTGEASAAAESIAESAQTMADEAERLQELIRRFSL